MSSPELKALIFDVDGTLADTEMAHMAAFNEAFIDEGLPWRWDVELYTKLLDVSGGKERIRHYMQKYHPAELNKSGLDAWIEAGGEVALFDSVN